MSGAVIPQWKVALQQKLDKKKEDERRKLLEEEQRRLAALPPWKRMGMVPQNVIIISGGTKTVSKLSNDLVTVDDGKKREEPSKSKNVKSVKSGFGESGKTTFNRKASKTNHANVRTSVGNVEHSQENHVTSTHTESNLTNHVGEDESDSGKAALVVGREGVDEEHVSSVLNNPFLKHDGGMRRRRGFSASQHDEDNGSKTTDSITVAKKKPDNNIRQRSRSASPRRAAREHNVDLKLIKEDLPEMRPRKNSVSDLRSRFGRVASVDDFKIVARKPGESDDNSPVLSPRSPTIALDRNKLFDEQPRKVHINYTPDSSNRLAPTSPSTVSTSTTSSGTSDKLPSTRPQMQKSTVVADSTLSKQSNTKTVSVTAAKVGSTSSNGITVKRQAPKAPTTPDSAKTSFTSSTVSPTNQNAVKPANSDVQKSNKPVESSNTARTNDMTLPDQPKTAVLGDGQSSLRRKKGISKMSASALISLSSENSNDVQLSEHNARVRAAREEARASSSKNLLRSAKDRESKDTDSIPKGVVSLKVKTSQNHTAPTANSKDESPYVDTIPYPENFRQPKKESTYVDTIPYPENFRQPKSNVQENPEPKAPSVKLESNSKMATVDDIPRTNIDEVVLSPIQENATLDSSLTNGSVEEKAPPKKIRKKLEVEWIGYNTPTEKPSALKSSASKSHKSEQKKERISFNESNLSETYEYQSESSLLNEYLREERGMNGNPRVGNLPRQEAQDEDDEGDDIDSTPASSQSSIDNVLAHEGLQNYTPKDLQNFSPMSFRQQQREDPKPREEPTPPPTEEPDPDNVAITYDDTGDYFSSAGSGSAALLF